MKKYLVLTVLTFALLIPSGVFAQMATSPAPLCPNGMTVASNCVFAPTTQSVPLCPNGMTMASDCATYPGGTITPISTTSTINSCVALTYSMSLGSRDLGTNGQVSKLQSFLQKNGYSTSNPTGYFGTATAVAVKAFQNANGITPASGIVGAVTRSQIQTMTCLAPPPQQVSAISFKFAAAGDSSTYSGTMSLSDMNGKVINPTLISGFAPYFSLSPAYYNATFSVNQYYNGVSQDQTRITLKIKAGGTAAAPVYSVDGNSVIVNGNLPSDTAHIFINAIIGAQISTATIQETTSLSSVKISLKLLNGGSGPVVQTTQGYLLPMYKLPVGSYTAETTISEGANSSQTTRFNVDVNTSGYSISYISQTQPSITVLSPNSGETWNIGSTQTIKYDINNIAVGPDNLINIYLEKGYDYPSTKIGANSSILIATTKDTESYNYTVDSAPFNWPGVGTNYKIKVCAGRNCSISDTSDNYFTISSATTQTQPTASVTGVPALVLSYDGLRNESSLVATANISVTAGSIPLKVLDSQYMSISFTDGTNPNVSTIKYGFSPLTPLVRGTDGNGLTYSIVPAGTSAMFVLQAAYNPQQMFAGVYKASVPYLQILPALNGDKTLYLAENLSNSVPVIGEKSPYITSVTQSVKSGDVLTVLGSRLFNGTALFVDGREIDPLGKMNSTDGTKVYFTVPTWDAGQHYIEVSNRYGKSNKMYFTVTGGTVTTQPTVYVVAGPTLKLNYDSAQKESSLVGNVTVRVTAGSSDLQLLNFADFYVSGPNNGGYNNQVVINLSKQSDGKTISVIPSGTTVTFSLSNTANPQQLFAGTYTAQLRGLYYTDPTNTTNTITLNVPTNQSNSVTIIGEKSPYINSVTQSIAPSGVLTVLGSRLYPMASMYLDGAAINPRALINSTSGSNLMFTVPANLASGQHSIEISNGYGKSNRKYFSITGSTVATQPTVSVIGTPVLSLTYDSIKRESQLTTSFSIMFTNGSSDVKIYKNAPSILATESNSDHSMYTSGSLEPTTSLPYDGSSYTVPAGKSVQFKVVGYFNPRIMFPGTYKTSLSYFSTTQQPVTIASNWNYSNSVTIVGETSPYLNLLSEKNPVPQGTVMSLTGVRLSGASSVSIDKQPVAVTGLKLSETFMSFILPKSVPAGQHTIQVSNPSGASNIVWFAVSGSTYPSISILNPTAGMTFTQGQSNTISWQAVGSNANYVLGYNAALPEGKGAIASLSAAQAHCDAADKCYYYWTPNFSSSNATISVYDTVSGQSAISGAITIVPLAKIITTASETILGLSPVNGQITFAPGQTINYSARGVASDGSIPDFNGKGFNVQAIMSDSSNRTVTVGGVAQSVNANFNYTTNNWDISMKAPSDTSLTYTVRTSFYCSTSRPGYCDENNTAQIDKSFTFKVGPSTPTAPAITVLSPNGGDQFTQGSSNNITWSAPGLSTVSIYLLNNRLMMPTIAANISNTGSYNWTVPTNLSGTQFQVYIGAPGVLPDDSNNTFSIVTPTIPIPVPTPGPIAPPTPTVNHFPVGALDGITTAYGIFGWAVDPDTISTTAPVNVYIDGPAGTGVYVGNPSANASSPDLDSVYPGGHRFFFPVPAQYKDGKSHSVYVYGIDTSDYSKHTLLPGSSKTFQISSATTTTARVGSAISSAVASVFNALVGQDSVAPSTASVPSSQGSSVCVALDADLQYPNTDAVSSGAVSKLQGFLNANGYLVSSPTGNFGLETYYAVKSFQTASGVNSTGYVGALTRAKIQEVSCK